MENIEMNAGTDEVGIVVTDAEVQGLMDAIDGTGGEGDEEDGNEVAAPNALAPDATLADVIAALNALVAKPPKAKRDRGPESTRDMTEADAKRIMLGDLKDTAHTEAATILGLSYGQVYSARFGHTFKWVYQEASKSKSYKWVVGRGKTRH